MSSKFSLIEIYIKIIEACGAVVSEDDRLRRPFNGSLYPLTAKGTNGPNQQIALPTKVMLKDQKFIAEGLFFHPFSENILAAGEPRVLNAIKTQCIRAWSDFIKNIMEVILEISNGSVNPADLTEQQREVIEQVGKVDEKFINSFRNIIKKLANKSTRSGLVSLSLIKDFKYNGKKYKRGAIWSFPLIDELEKVKEECNRDKSIKARILDIDIRKSDLVSLTNLCNVVFGDEKVRSDAIGASDSKDAPYSESFVRALYYLKRISKLIEIFFKGKHHVYSKEVADDFLKKNYIDLSWLNDDFKISDWKKECLELPQYEGNEGENPINQSIDVKRKENLDMHKWEKNEEDDLPWVNDNQNSVNYSNQSVNNQAPQQGYQKQNEPMGSGDSLLDRLSNQANINKMARNGYYYNPPMVNNQPPMGQPMVPVQNVQPQLQIDNMGREFYIDQYGRVNYTGKQVQQAMQPQIQTQFDNAGREFSIDQFGNTQYTGRQRQVDQYGRECIIDQYNNVQYTGRQYPVQRPLTSAAQMTMSQPVYTMNNPNTGTFFASNQQNYAPMGYNRPNNGYQAMPQSISGLTSISTSVNQQQGYGNTRQVGLSGSPA